MLQHAHGLSAQTLASIAGLERLVVDADGGRLKLEWGRLRSRGGGLVEDLLWWDEGQLLGFVGLYAFGPSLELAGMVAPAVRRRGIATALLDTALPLCRDRGCQQALLVVPRGSAAGTALSLHRGGTLDHSERALVLLGEPNEGAGDPRITLTQAGPEDAAVMSRLLEDSFGQPAPPTADLLAAKRILLIRRDGSPVGTLRMERDGEQAGIYGFAVHPAWQGRGIGRDVLRRVCRQLRDEGVRRIRLEVAVGNDHALRLYQSVGFTEVTGEDYYALPLH